MLDLRPPAATHLFALLYRELYKRAAVSSFSPFRASRDW